MEPWTRPRWSPNEHVAKLELVAFSDQHAPDPLPLSQSRHGMLRTDGAMALEVQRFFREQTSGKDWLSEELDAYSYTVAGTELGAKAAKIVTKAKVAYVIRATVPSPSDLTHLQAAWAIARCLVEHGATLLVDLQSDRAFFAEHITAVAVDAPFDLLRDVSLVVDDNEPCMVFSRGLAKLGHADVALTQVERAAIAEAATLLRDLVQLIADGEHVEPGDTLAAGGLEFDVERGEMIDQLRAEARGGLLRLVARPPAG